MSMGCGRQYELRGDTTGKHLRTDRATGATTSDIASKEDGPQDRGVARRLEEHQAVHGDLRARDRGHHLERARV
jgi:hypothetical protein